jgi:K+-sensing histidine kinase KdpD
VNRDLILVADDVTDDLNRLRDALGRLGYHVITVRSGEDALAHAQKHLPSTVIVDLLMSGSDGLEVCRRLRQDRLTAAVPIIAVTTATDPQMRLAALEAGADELLTHPLDWVEARTRLHSLRLDAERESKTPTPVFTSPRAERAGIADLLDHDLKSPLAIITGALGLLAEASRPANMESERRLVQSALAAVRRQVRLIDDMFDLVRLEANALELRVESVDVVHLVAETLAEAEGAIESKRLRVINRLPADLPPAAADTKLLQRVLLSLIDNALKFSIQGGTLTIDARANSHTLTLTLTDTGRALLPEYAPVIFDWAIQRRARWDGSRTSVALGLPFCWAAVKAMGGNIGAHSSDDGSHTTFTIELPVRTGGA